MQKISLFSKFKKLSLISGVVVTLILGSLLLIYQATMVKRAVYKEGEFLTNIVFTNLYNFMQKGWNKSDIANRLNEINASRDDINFHMHRSQTVIDLYGERKSTKPFTKAEAEILQGIGSKIRIGYQPFSGFLYSKPLYFQSECLGCHTNAREGEVAGVISINYSLQSLKVPMLQSFIVNMGLLLLTVVVSYFVYTQAIKANIIHPFSRFVKKMKAISQSKQLPQSPSRTVIAEIAEIEDLVLKEHANLIQAFNKLEQASFLDPLTELFNRKKLTEVLATEIECFQRYQTPFSVLSIDLNHFKPINDTYGHSVGDEALCHFSRLVSKQLRVADYAFRLGGDEFLVLLPNASKKEACLVQHKIEKSLSVTPMTVNQSELFLSASFGVCEVMPEDCFESLLNRADEEMYQCKRALKAGQTDAAVV